jgi:hypothetical protein
VFESPAIVILFESSRAGRVDCEEFAALFLNIYHLANVKKTALARILKTL